MKAGSISQKRLCIKRQNNNGDEMKDHIPNTGNKCLDGGTYSIPATFREKKYKLAKSLISHVSNQRKVKCK